MWNGGDDWDDLDDFQIFIDVSRAEHSETAMLGVWCEFSCSVSCGSASAKWHSVSIFSLKPQCLCSKNIWKYLKVRLFVMFVFCADFKVLIFVLFSFLDGLESVHLVQHLVHRWVHWCALPFSNVAGFKSSCTSWNGWGSFAFCAGLVPSLSNSA